MGSNRDAIINIVEIKGLRSRGHGMDLHLGWHVCFFHHSFSFQHPFVVLCYKVFAVNNNLLSKVEIVAPKKPLYSSSKFQTQRWFQQWWCIGDWVILLLMGWHGTTSRDTRNLTFMFSYLVSFVSSLSLSLISFSHSIQSSTNYKPLWLHFLSLFFNLQLFILIHLFYKKIYLISRWKHITRYQMWKTESRYFAVNVKIWRKI